ncbi:MAG TPA: class I SAM-dependent methyltransferase, partial [Castellaniella sp.]|nr:class I SAM-dependent methyltransferase [Castellaniella sp.]
MASSPQDLATPEQSTHFGFQTVPEADKARRVADVFHSVASRYDIMNDL